jgi:hypothetical protein
MIPMMIRRVLLPVLALLLLGGCSVRLGGPGPVEYRTVALSTGAGAEPVQVAEYIRQAGANLVLLAAQADSAWFAEVARQSKLTLSGPGDAGGVSLAFLASAPVGDTTVTLSLESGGKIVLHDALYRVDKHRYLDLMALRLGSGVDARTAVQALLRYMAADVMSDAAVVLAIDVPDAATGDAVAELLQPAFRDARRCIPGAEGAGGGGGGVAEGAGGAAGAGPGMRLFYGPEARLRCESARHLGSGAGAPVVAQFIIDR